MNLDDLDLDVLGQRLLRPDRAQAVEVIAILTGARESKVREVLSTSDKPGQKVPFNKLWGDQKITDPLVALETLATRGLVPYDWVSSTERDFLDEKLVPRPNIPSLEHVVALASDVQGVLLTEELAREVSSRLSRWIDEPRVDANAPLGQLHWSKTHLAKLKEDTAPSDKAARKMSWRIGVHCDGTIRSRRWPQTTPHAYSTRAFTGAEALSFLSTSIRSRVPVPHASDESLSARAEGDDAPASLRDLPLQALRAVQSGETARLSQGIAAWDVYCEMAMRLLARRGASIQAFPGPDGRVDRFDPNDTSRLLLSTLASPFLPLLHIWNAGYCLEEITPHRITLFAPRGWWQGREGSP